MKIHTRTVLSKAILLATISAVFMPVLPAKAVFKTYAHAEAEGTPKGEEGTFSAAASDNSSKGNGTNTASTAAEAHAFLGHLHVEVTASGSGSAIGSSSAGAQFADVLIISNPSLDGTTGVFIASMTFHGNLSAESSGDFPGKGDAVFLGSFLVISQSTSFNVGLTKSSSLKNTAAAATSSGDSLPFVITIPVTFTFGQPIFVLGEILASATGGNGAVGSSGSAAAFFNHTAYWNGISEVTANGTPIPFQVTSESQTDYRQSFASAPIPEPGSLLIMGTAALLLCRRRHLRIN